MKCAAEMIFFFLPLLRQVAQLGLDPANLIQEIGEKIGFLKKHPVITGGDGTPLRHWR